MPCRNLVSYNALIAAYARNQDNAFLALKVYKEMRVSCVGLNSLTFSSLFQAVSYVEDWSLGSALHAQVVKFGFGCHICLQTSLLGMYSNCGDLVSAKKLFGNIVDKDAVCWNSMIFGYLKNNLIMESLILSVGMLRSGVSPTQFTYSMVLNGCSKLGNDFYGKMIHARVITSDMPMDLPLNNALIDMYCSCGDVEAAYTVFSRIKNPDLVSLNSMIAGYSEIDDGEKAIDLFIELQQGGPAKPDEYTYAAVISATGSFLASDYGMPLHACVIKEGFEGSVFVGSTLVSMYFKNMESDSAHKGGHKMDSFSLSGALSACADLATLRQGEIIHAVAVKTVCDDEISVCGSLIDMYAKSGNLQAAEVLFKDVKAPDLKCWNSMLSGYSHNGKANEALKLFDGLLENRLKPDQVTLLCCLSACSHCGLVQQGKFFWKYMKENGFLPGPKHYSCMVSLLSRAGSLDEAKKLISESPFCKDNLELWRTLLSSCITHKNFETGVYAAEQVLRYEAEDSATHILLSNLYAVIGSWDNVASVRRKMRGFSMEKDPGLSWIEVMNTNHVFSSGDQSHPEVDQAEAELHSLYGNMVKSEKCRIAIV
ncbi:Pentatricopeptide repeat [Dillenia turbinata]|uniref:Pentatricopeptide repeat n=1 Tax=Dillenia turbinata TaxID=194707 RepID=A0AAN8Z873_9MAGN